MRVTQRSMTTSSLAGLQSNLNALNKLQNQLTSGKVLTRPSDSPTDTSKAMQTRDSLASNTQVARNITDATSRLNQADGALDKMQDLLTRVQTLAVQGANTGSNDATSNAALATEITALRSSLIGMANSTYNGQPLFGGVTTGATAYDADGTYTGVDGYPTMQRISDSENIQVDITGTEAFGDQGSGDDLFAVVQRVADLLNADPVDSDAIATGLSDLSAAKTRLSTAQATIGARQSRVDTADSLNEDQKATLTTQLSSLEDSDYAETAMQLSNQQVVYQAALQVSAKILQPSLMDYLS